MTDDRPYFVRREGVKSLSQQDRENRSSKRRVNITGPQVKAKSDESSRLLTPERYTKIKELLGKGMALTRIAKSVRLRLEFIKAVLDGRITYDMSHDTTLMQSKLDDILERVDTKSSLRGKVCRCSGCGHMVVMPCQYCIATNYKENVTKKLPLKPEVPAQITQPDDTEIHYPSPNRNEDGHDYGYR